jgi:4-amino-4-deoxy-L-arabinose transferase-like glycosyltransferase
MSERYTTQSDTVITTSEQNYKQMAIGFGIIFIIFLIIGLIVYGIHRKEYDTVHTSSESKPWWYWTMWVAWGIAIIALISVAVAVLANYW